MPGRLRSLCFAMLATLLVSAAPDEAKPRPLPEPKVDEQTGVRWYRNIFYVEDDSAHPRKHRMHILLPGQDRWRPGRPLLIWIHGGGWTFGDKDDAFGLYTKYCRALAENGVATANISYRLSPEFKHPAHIQDVAAATAWLIKRAPELGFDPKHVFVSGHSAGGHLAALLATDHRWLEAHGVGKGAIAGALPSSGVFDLESLVSASPRWGRTFAVEDARDASPMTHIDPADPPFVFFVEGNGRFMQRQTRTMAEALQSAGVKHEVVGLPGVNHVTMLADLLSGEGTHAAVTLKFIDDVIHGHTATQD